MTALPGARPWWVPSAALAVGLLVLLTPLNEQLSRSAHDAQLRLIAPSHPAKGVLVFDIDDASLAALKPHFGTWPFKRDVYALAIELLRELGASAIAIDLLLADEHPGDISLARAIARPGAPVVLGAAGLRHASDDAPAMPAAKAQGASTSAQSYGWPAMALPTRSVWPTAQLPHLGVITSPLDGDGALRSLPLRHHAGDLRLPSMPVALLQLTDAAGPWTTAPTDRQGALHIPFPGRSGLVDVHPFASLAEVALLQRPATALEAVVRGRIVFIGSSALLADSVMTVSGQASGTTVLAQATAALQERAWVLPPSLRVDGLLLVIALLPAALTVVRGRALPSRDMLLALMGLALLAGAMWFALMHGRQPTHWAAPVLALASGLALSLFAHQRRQMAEQRELEHQLAVVAEAAHAKSTFLANVSHEIRTPLNALLGVAELLDHGPLSPQQRQHVQVFRESGQALHELINDLLDLSKIEAGRFELERVAFSLHHLLEHLYVLLRPRAEGKGLLLRLDIEPSLPDGVLGDRRRLEQALLNLLGNAIKFTPRGEVRLRAAADATTVTDATGFVRFDVDDTGIGIAPSKLDVIFEPFAQADGSVTRLYGGTGLGLAITKRMAGLMGGTLQVRSTPGVGSSFALRLPLAACELPVSPAALTLEATPTAVLSGPRTVLLAEDNEINVYIFRAMLEGQPVTLEVAANGPMALDLLRRRSYDLAFIDVQMPGMDGLSVTRELRRHEATSGRLRTPVVALTANAFATDVQASVEAGCDRHVAKPFARVQLLRALVELTGARASESAAANTPLPVSGAPVASDRSEGSAAEMLDTSAAIARLGGDTELLQRVTEHAAVFMQEWASNYERVRAEGSAPRALRLAHDLKGIAATVGAQALADSAQVLEQALDTLPEQTLANRGEPLAEVLTRLAPVIAALTQAAGAQRR